MVTGESCQCIRHTKQTSPSEVDVRHTAYTVPKCCFVIQYQNTSNLDRRTDHFNLVDGLRKSSVNWSGKVWTERVGMGELEGRSCDLKKHVCVCMWYVIMLQDHRYLEPPILGVQTVYVSRVNILIPSPPTPLDSNNVQNRALSPTTSSQWCDVHTQIRIK